VVVADEPDKVDPGSGGDAATLRIGPTLKTMVDNAHEEVLLVSPYFVPGDNGTRFLTTLAQRGVAVRVLTNSLASTDEPAVHSGYAHYRRALLQGGVQLYELQPATGAPQPATAAGTSSGVSLHAKAMVVDGAHVFIGSMNMDQRSKLLNTEMGVIIDSAPLAQAVEKFFDTAIEPGNAYHVVLQASPDNPERMRMTWLWSEKGVARHAYSDPKATRMRRLEVSLLGLLPIEGLL
jgi:putative cardiolipin synthase